MLKRYEAEVAFSKIVLAVTRKALGALIVSDGSSHLLLNRN